MQHKKINNSFHKATKERGLSENIGVRALLTCEASSFLSSAHPSWWHFVAWCTPPSGWTASRRSCACCWTGRRSPPSSAEVESCWRDSRCGRRWTARRLCVGPRKSVQAPEQSRSCLIPTCTAPEEDEEGRFCFERLLRTFILFCSIIYEVSKISAVSLDPPIKALEWSHSW